MSRRLQHRNLLKVLELTIDEEFIAISQELMSGGDLLGAVRANVGLPADQGAAVLEGICSALTYMHTELGLVHCDVKCENILLAPDPRSVVVVRRAASLRCRAMRCRPQLVWPARRPAICWYAVCRRPACPPAGFLHLRLTGHRPPLSHPPPSSTCSGTGTRHWHPAPAPGTGLAPAAGCWPSWQTLTRWCPWGRHMPGFEAQPTATRQSSWRRLAQEAIR